MARAAVAITIDSPRWRDGWGEPLSGPLSESHSAPAPPALRLVGGGHRRPAPDVLRRRRLAVLVVVCLVLALGLAIGTALLSRPAAAGAMPEGRRVHVVAPGETYWSIADAYTDRGDLRLAVDSLIDANGARPLLPGDVIELP